MTLIDAAIKDLEMIGDCRTCGNKTPFCDSNPDSCKGYKWRGAPPGSAAEENPPMTIEELREMDGDWVWIKLFVPLYRMYTGYYLKKTQFSDTDKFCCGYPGVVVMNLSYAGYEDTWIAYRRRPEDEP